MPLRRVGEIVLGAALYVLASKLGFALAFVGGTVSAVWPPTGVALVLVVLFGPRMLLAVVLGEVVANMLNGSNLGLSVAFGTGNALEALAAYLLLRRAGFRPQLDRVRDVFALLVLAAVLSTMVSATVATAAFLVDGLPAAAVWDVWHTWWLGDLTGDLVVAPLGFVVLTTRVNLPRGLGHRLEALGFAAALAAMFVLAGRSSVGAGYLALPVLLWGALRFGQLGATVANATLAGAGILTAATAGSELARVAVAERVLYTQNFVAVAALTTLFIAALLQERARAQEDLSRKEAETARLAAEQHALRRVATAVAREGTPDAIFWTIAAEAGRLLGAATATVERRTPAETVATWTNGGSGSGELSAPIVVACELWGHLVVTGVPADAHARLAPFADLAAIAAARTSVTTPASPALP